jgi:hypothetical protein
VSAKYLADGNVARLGKVSTMNKGQKETIATVDDEDLKVFVRSSPEELEASELNLVAGGIGTCIVPNG